MSNPVAYASRPAPPPRKGRCPRIARGPDIAEAPSPALCRGRNPGAKGKWRGMPLLRSSISLSPAHPRLRCAPPGASMRRLLRSTSKFTPGDVFVSVFIGAFVQSSPGRWIGGNPAFGFPWIHRPVCGPSGLPAGSLSAGRRKLRGLLYALSRDGLGHPVLHGVRNSSVAAIYGHVLVGTAPGAQSTVRYRVPGGTVRAPAAVLAACPHVCRLKVTPPAGTLSSPPRPPTCGAESR